MCATAASDERNRSRRERRFLRWVAVDAQTLCCTGARSVIEITREVTMLAGKDKGKQTREQVLCVSSLEMEPDLAHVILKRNRDYWSIEAKLHQRLDVTAREDDSRVRNRNGLLVLGILRRASIGIYEKWRTGRKNQRQSTLKDFHDAMGQFNQSQAFALCRRRIA